MSSRGIIYEYEDGGKYCGEWENDAAHGHGVCSGPQGNGLFEGLWEKGNQSSGVFTWPNGQKYTGKWRQGMRDGLGKETKSDGTEYCGEFTQDSRGLYGVLRQPNGVIYRGVWSKGVQNGEGTEIYIDGGMYRGEYRHGYRHGHGTRSSANYEQTGDQSSLNSNQSSTSLSSMLKVLEAPPSSVDSPKSTLERADFQVYEGEWHDDKRHGHGVLKILGHYTYYGQWENNMRSGYGVMIYDSGRKEEGQWQRGKLVQPLKRKKLQLKMRQLESKVNAAHTNALQAADTARLKADLAEGRANTASSKFRQAVRVVQQALKDAETARKKEGMYKSAPKVKEGIVSPVTETKFLACDSFAPLLREQRGRSDTTESSGLLTLPRPIPTTSSFEDIQSLASDATMHVLAKENSESGDDSLNGHELSAGGSVDSSVSEVTTHVDDAKVRREQYRTSSAVSIRREMGYGPHSNSGGKIISDSLAERLKRKMRLLDIAEVSGSDSNLLVRSDAGEDKSTWSRSSSGPLPVTSAPTSHARQTSEDLRRRHINKATGEPAHGDNTDEEEPSPDRLALHKPLKKPPSISVDMLHQLASWNRMVAYLNFALLLFLLFLIIVVIIVLNYYYIVNQFSSLPPSPASFIPGPMA